MKFEDIETDDSGIEEVDLSEGAMYKRAFKKFYNKMKKGKVIVEEETDCEDIDEEDDEDLEVDVTDEDVEIDEEEEK